MYGLLCMLVLSVLQPRGIFLALSGTYLEVSVAFDFFVAVILVGVGAVELAIPSPRNATFSSTKPVGVRADFCVTSGV